METQSSIPNIDILSEIWRRSLRSEHVNLEANFFDQGGDPATAERLFREIKLACGRELPPLAIYLAPTINSQFALLNHPKPLPFPASFLLKSGAEEPPIFMAHGLGGSVLDFSPLLRHLPTSHPVYGIQTRGSDGLQEPCLTVEDMANFHLEAIRHIQPHGPYFLIGYSFGGLIMLEVAEALKKAGEEIGLLAMVDTFPFRSFLPLGQRLQRIYLLIRLHSINLCQMPAPEVLPYLRSRTQRQAYIAKRRRSRASVEIAGTVPPTASMQRVRVCADQAWKKYPPRFYDGKILFIYSETNSYFAADPIALWKGLAKELKGRKVPGDHIEILTTRFDSAAAVVFEELQQAFKENLLKAETL